MTRTKTTIKALGVAVSLAAVALLTGLPQRAKADDYKTTTFNPVFQLSSISSPLMTYVGGNITTMGN